MRGMFFHCSNLIELNILNFNTKNTKDMFYMFGFCSKLKNLKISSNFKINQTENLNTIFDNCKDLNFDNLRLSNKATIFNVNISRINFKFSGSLCYYYITAIFPN